MGAGSQCVCVCENTLLGPERALRIVWFGFSKGDVTLSACLSFCLIYFVRGMCKTNPIVLEFLSQFAFGACFSFFLQAQGVALLPASFFFFFRSSRSLSRPCLVFVSLRERGEGKTRAWWASGTGRERSNVCVFCEREKGRGRERKRIGACSKYVPHRLQLHLSSRKFPTRTTTPL